MKTNDLLRENPEIGIHAQEMHEDHQHQMLREECYHTAVNAVALHKLLHELDPAVPLAAWAAEKISLANDYIKTVREWLEYELMSSDIDVPDFDETVMERAYRSLLNKRNIRENATAGATGAGNFAAVSEPLGGMSRRELQEKQKNYSNRLSAGGPVRVGEKKKKKKSVSETKNQNNQGLFEVFGITKTTGQIWRKVFENSNQFDHWFQKYQNHVLVHGHRLVKDTSDLGDTQ
jgi:hypothetical protein